MKRMKRILLVAMALLVAATNASAIQMERNGKSWFLPDGRIVQTKRVFTGNGSEYPGLLCYDQSGALLWEHTFRTPAIGRSDCELTDENNIAFMYHDRNHQYFVEYFTPEGELVEKCTREAYTTDGILYEDGAVFCGKLPEQKGSVLNIRHWDGSEKRWVFQDAEGLTLFSVKSYGNALYIELCLHGSGQSAYSILCVDAAEENVLWEYRLDTGILHPVNAYIENEQGGVTLFVQKDAPNDQYELEMITLDANGTEVGRVKVEGIPAVMAMNVVDDQKGGLYRIWGYGYETYGEDAVICATLNDQGKVVERQDIPVEYATCVRYLNDEVYVMLFENGLETFELVPFDQFLREHQTGFQN